jgi:hypothetical protein
MTEKAVPTRLFLFSLCFTGPARRGIPPANMTSDVMAPPVRRGTAGKQVGCRASEV